MYFSDELSYNVTFNGDSFPTKEYHICTIDEEFFWEFFVKIPIDAVITNVEFPENADPRKKRCQGESASLEQDSSEDNLFPENDFFKFMKFYRVTLLFKSPEILMETDEALGDCEDVDFVNEFFGELPEEVKSLEEVD